MTQPKSTPSTVVVKADRPTKVSNVGRSPPVSVAETSGRLDTRARPSEGLSSSWLATGQYAEVLSKLRRRRKWRVLRWFAGIVALPTLLTFCYYFFLATPVYSSETEFTYQTYRGQTSLASGLVQSVSGTSQTNTIDLGTIIYEYIRSPALAEKLATSLDLRKRFSDDKIDWWARLNPKASRERFLDYYRSMVHVSLGLGGYLDVKVDAFDPAFAQNLARAIVTAADQMIDDLTSRERKNELQFAEAELSRQESRVKTARLALTQFQNQHGDQDPNRAATQIGGIVGTLEGELTSARTQLANNLASLSPTSPIITQLKLNIASLETQLKDQQQRLATEQNGQKSPFSEILNQYSGIQLEQEFSKNAYMGAQQGVVVARANVATKQNYMIDFAPPSQPDQKSWGRLIEATVTVFLSSLILFVFGGLVLGASHDQIAG